MSWHVAEADLHGYVADRLPEALSWSVETHVVACPTCRARIGSMMESAVAVGWRRLDAALDAPRPGLVERAMVRLGTPEHIARLLAATPTLRLSWLGAVAVTLTLTVLAGVLTHGNAPLPLLAVAPLLALAGVALSFRHGLDPTYELTVVAPMSAFRLMLLRSVVVLVTSTGLTGIASLALPSAGLLALGWLLPTLALTLLSLALLSRVGVLVASATVGLCWAAALALTIPGGLSPDGLPSNAAAVPGLSTGGRSVIFTPPGQLACAFVALLAALAIWRLRPSFDFVRRPVPGNQASSWRSM